MKKIVIIFLLSATFIGLILSHLKYYISIETLIQSLTLLFTIIAFMVNLDVTQSQIKTVMKKSEFDTRIEHLKLFSEYYDSCVEDCNNEIKRREEQHKKMKDDYLKKVEKQQNTDDFNEKTKGLTDEILFFKQIRMEFLRFEKTNFYYHFFLSDKGEVEERFNDEYIKNLINEVGNLVKLSKLIYPKIKTSPRETLSIYKRKSRDISFKLEGEVSNFFNKDKYKEPINEKYLLQKNNNTLLELNYIVSPILWVIRLHIINKLLKFDPFIYNQTKKVVDLTVLNRAERFVYDLKNDKAIKDNFKTLSNMERIFTCDSCSY